MIKQMARRIYSIFEILRVGKNSKISFKSYLLGKNKFEGRNVINKNNYIKNCSFGYASFMGENNFFVDACVGKFCSIGNNVKVISATHPSSVFVSTHPAFYRSQYGIFKNTSLKFTELITYDENVCVLVGNDVWIGDNVLIKGGVKIGDGAIIAMGSVVVKDVEPYSIVGGVPAKNIRSRFNSNEIQKLIEFKWWNRDIEWIDKHLGCFGDIKKFMEMIENENC